MKLQFIRNVGFILLAVYLILIGISAFLPIGFAIPIQIYSAVALAAGVFILIGR